MSAADKSALVRDDRAQHRFVREVGGAVAELVYEIDADRLTLLHTEVPEAFRRQGIGGELVSAAVALAFANQLTIVPSCPFTRRWLRQHPEAVASVAVDWTTPQPDA